VFTDVVLPGMSGVDLVSILGERWPDLGILLTSGYTDQKSQWQKILDRGYHFLPKPYDVPALLKNVRKAIR
jgi:two-component system cell cycle sensor histidine kinase/response regulator CckA